MKTNLLKNVGNNTYKVVNNIMFWYQPILILFSIIVPILFGLDFWGIGKININALFLTTFTSNLTNFYAKLTTLLTLFSCVMVISQPFAF